MRGFREAALAAFEARAAAPLRLELVGPTGELGAYLEAWAEDVAQVRRTLLVARRFDGRAFRVVATLAAHGHGIATSLAVESLSPPEDDEHEIFRSGVHLKINIEAALARYREAMDDDEDEDEVFPPVAPGRREAPALVDVD